MPVWVYHVPVAVVFVGAMVIAIGAVIKNVRQLGNATAADAQLTSGTPGTARVLSAEWTGAVINLEYVCQIGLRVEIPGREPYDVKIEQRVDPPPVSRPAARHDCRGTGRSRQPGQHSNRLHSGNHAAGSAIGRSAADRGSSGRRIPAKPRFDPVGLGSRFTRVGSARPGGTQVVCRHGKYAPAPRQGSQQAGIP